MRKLRLKSRGWKVVEPAFELRSLSDSKGHRLNYTLHYYTQRNSSRFGKRRGQKIFFWAAVFRAHRRWVPSAPPEQGQGGARRSELLAGAKGSGSCEALRACGAALGAGGFHRNRRLKIVQNIQSVELGRFRTIFCFHHLSIFLSLPLLICKIMALKKNMQIIVRIKWEK